MREAKPASFSHFSFLYFLLLFFLMDGVNIRICPSFLFILILFFKFTCAVSSPSPERIIYGAKSTFSCSVNMKLLENKGRPIRDEKTMMDNSKSIAM